MTLRIVGILAIVCVFTIEAESSLTNFYRKFSSSFLDRGLKIYNGRTADKSDYRWMVWLYDEDKNKMVCGASLIKDQWVMTTAACASSDFTSVVVGDYNMYKPDGEQLIAVSQVVIHPEFNSSTHANDIALVKLVYPVDFSFGGVEVVPRLSSPRVDDMPSKVCMLTGWGLTSSINWRWPTATNLQELRVFRDNSSDCEAMGLNIPTHSFCFKAARKHASPCMRDEGSPIVCKIKNKWTQVGMYSYARTGDGCKFGPKGATQISSFQAWIRNTTR